MKGNVEGVDVELKLVKNGLITQTRVTDTVTSSVSSLLGF